MVFVITGNGKGKTTSALGMVARESGHEEKCAVIQFLKANPSVCGEYKFFTEKGIEWETYGKGFTWECKDLSETAELCRKGWDSFVKKTQTDNYGMIVLDEFTYVLENNFLDNYSVYEYLKTLKKTNLHVVITGRRASLELIRIADTVSEVREIKHHFNSNQFKTVAGIEF